MNVKYIVLYIDININMTWMITARLYPFIYKKVRRNTLFDIYLNKFVNLRT
jgi:hypothetical protein